MHLITIKPRPTAKHLPDENFWFEKLCGNNLLFKSFLNLNYNGSEKIKYTNCITQYITPKKDDDVVFISSDITEDFIWLSKQEYDLLCKIPPNAEMTCGFVTGSESSKFWFNRKRYEFWIFYNTLNT